MRFESSNECFTLKVSKSNMLELFKKVEEIQSSLDELIWL